MDPITRNLSKAIDIFHKPETKMLFLAGPRQVGKTTFAKIYAAGKYNFQYLNWDNSQDQKKILALAGELDIEEPGKTRPELFLIDEIHKYPKWKNYLKGIFDKHFEHYRFLITGSARLDVFRKGADSLQGRYFLYHIFPFTLGELFMNEISKTFSEIFKPGVNIPIREGARALYENLFIFSGFPEPFAMQSQTHLNRWNRLRKDRFIKEDVRDTTKIADFIGIEHLVELLPSKIGSPLSVNSLREDINVAYNTIANWLRQLEILYHFFTLRPYTKKINRALLKEPKIYLYNYSTIKDISARFENLIALHLYKNVMLINDFGISNSKIYYVRDKNKKEIDFLIEEDDKLITLIECKVADTEPSSNLFLFAEKLNIKIVFQVINAPNIHKIYKKNEIECHVISAEKFLCLLL